MNIDEKRATERKNGGEVPRPEGRSPAREDVDERLKERKQQVFDDAMEEALALPDPFEAFLAANTARLARIAEAIGERVVRILDDPEMQLQDAAAGVGMHGQVSRQIERNMQLRRRDQEILRREREKPARLWHRLDR